MGFFYANEFLVNAYFDGLSLFQEGFGQTYTYDKDNNLIAVILSGVRYSCLRNAQNDIVGVIDKDGKRIVYYKS